MKLDKPGAGLPEAERLSIKNILVPIVRILFTWNIALFLLKREVKIIKNLVDKLPSEKCIQKNIIERTFAIEDDTRQFSVNMVLEHLTIAGEALMVGIKTLSDEKEFQRKITIEGVKPYQNKLNQIDDFVKFYNSYFEFIENLPKKQSKMTKAHPWFVEFNNFDWSVFMYMHTFIHRRQIEAIIKELK
jgi:hypothetical protein